MKKIISLVVMTAMLMTLFAVNASAAVFSGDIEKVFYPVNTFDTIDGWNSFYRLHSTYSFYGAFESVVDAEKGNVLQITLTGGGASQPSFVGIVEEGAPAFPEKYEISFAVKKTVDREAAPLVWIGDPALATNGGFGAVFGLGTKNLVYNKWYEYKIVIDKTTSSEFSATRRNVTDNGAWEEVKDNSAWDTGRYITSWQNNSASQVYPAYRAGFYFSSQSGMGAVGDSYMIDDFAVNTLEAIPSTGVYYSKDFEEDSTLKVRGGMGTAGSGKEENGNTYGILNVGSDGKMNIIPTAENTIKGLTSKDCWILEFDLCAKTAGSAFTAQVSCEDAAKGSMYTLKNLPVDTWYTYRMTYDGTKVAGNNSSRFIERTVRGTNNWEAVSAAGTDASFTDWENSGATETIVFMNGNTTVSTFWIDNITLSAHEAVSLPAVSVADNTMSITANFSDISALYSRPATMTAVLATFADNVLVDVDFKAVANNAGTIAADLEASVLGANKAELYVWDGIGTAKPILGTVYPLTSYLQ